MILRRSRRSYSVFLTSFFSELNRSFWVHAKPTKRKYKGEPGHRYWAYFDEAWKHVLERFFPELLHFFLPALAHDMDFTRPTIFLDKELEQFEAPVEVQSKDAAGFSKSCVLLFLDE